MFTPTRIYRALALSILLLVGLSTSAHARQKDSSAPAGIPAAWQDPGDISARDLRYGSGSTERAPAAPFTFVAEDTLGASPKFKVTDAKGVTWVVKLGEEAQAETVCSRLVWSMGYYVEEAYYFDRVAVKNLPKLSRGQEYVEGRLVVRGARFEPRRAEEQRVATWDWEKNPFIGTREFNGLKVMMALVANYDIRPENNLIVSVSDPQTSRTEARYMVGDIGATLGRVGGLGGKRAKNSLADYSASKFVLGVENGFVKFDYNTKPKGAGGFFAKIFNPGYSKSQAMKVRVIQNIPVADARWMGQQLSRLSDEQLRDAFRSAGYDTATMEGYVSAIRGRINQLNSLPEAATVAASGQNTRR